MNKAARPDSLRSMTYSIEFSSVIAAVPDVDSRTDGLPGHPMQAVNLSNNTITVAIQTSMVSQQERRLQPMTLATLATDAGSTTSYSKKLYP